MTNIVYLIGRFNIKPELTKIGIKNILIMNVKVIRTYKNKDGIYEEYIFYVEIPFMNGNQYTDYMNKDDLVGIKGHLEIRAASSLRFARNFPS